LNESNLPVSNTCFENKINSNSTLNLRHEATGQIVLMMGQATIAHGHSDDLTLRLLSCHLGVGMSSLLFRNLREQHGVAYEVGVHYPAREWEAPFLLHASTSEDKALITLQLLKEIWWGLSNELISEEELSLARAKFRGLIAHGSQTTSQRAERRAQLRSFGLQDDYDKKSVYQIASITSKEIQIVASRHLKKPLLSLCGPNSTLKNLSKNWNN